MKGYYGDSILERNGVFIPSEELGDSQLELLLERFAEKCTVNSNKNNDNIKEDYIEISVQREMFLEQAFDNLKKLITGKETILRHAFKTE